MLDISMSHTSRWMIMGITGVQVESVGLKSTVLSLRKIIGVQMMNLIGLRTKNTNMWIG